MEFRSQQPTLLLALAAIVAASACKSAGPTKADLAAQQLAQREAARANPQATALAVDQARVSYDVALDDATRRAVGWRTLPVDEPWQTILDPERVPEGSFSAGTVANGVLLDAAELPFTGEFHSIIERHRRHRTRWGTRELVDLIQAAAQHVYLSEGGAPLRIGNMSAKKGGDIRWSRSHNSGRDADLAFYVVTADANESVPAPDLLRFDDRGIPAGREDLRFDVPRNWRLVEGFLSQTEINVQWLFISIPLKEMLLAHAREIGADPEVIRRASDVLHQPTDSRPHADHFHLRVGCSRDDRLDGCLDYGPQWDWLDWHERHLLARSLRVAEAFDDGKTTDRARALEFLNEIKAPYAADIAGVWGFWDPEPTVRSAALSVADAQWGWSANALVQVQKLIAQGEPAARELRIAYGILRRSRDELARDFALVRLADASLTPAERALAASALGHFMEPEIIPTLVATLTDTDAEVRVASAEVLRRVTNRTEGVDWASCTPEVAAQAQTRWGTWWRSNESATRAFWLASGFRALGIDVEEEIEPRHLDELMALLQAEHSFVRYNANRTIREVTGRWAPLEQDDPKALVKYWKEWWKKNRDRVLSGELGAGS